MSALAINSLVENHVGNIPNHNLAAATVKSSDSTIIDRKHYSAATGGNHRYTSHEYSGQSYSGHQGDKKSHSIALTALTLLSFLFFLNILQQCLQDQMDQMNPQVVIMQARIKAIRQAQAKANKEAEKRIGETAEKGQTTVSETDKEPTVQSFKRTENEYQYEKVQVPVKIKSFESRRPYQ